MQNGTQTVRGRADIKDAYRDDERVRSYIETRYEGDPFGRRVHEEQSRVLVEMLNRLRPTSLLEVACGPARLTVEVPQFDNALAIDQSPQMLALARERLDAAGKSHWRVEEGDAFDLAVEPDSFDVVMSFKLIRHFDRPERALLFEQIRKALKPGGHLIFDVAHRPAYEWILAKWGVDGSWVDDYWFLLEEFKSEMTECGFEVVQTTPIMADTRLQYYLMSYGHRHLGGLSNVASQAVASLGQGMAYEWMAMCRCA